MVNQNKSSILSNQEINNILNLLDQEENALNQKNNEQYVKPQLKELTQEQIDDIHSRGRITPAEYLEELETQLTDICPVEFSGNNKRCNMFQDCHDCLVDIANQKEEWTSNTETIEMNGIVSENEMTRVLKLLQNSEEEKVKF